MPEVNENILNVENETAERHNTDEAPTGISPASGIAPVAAQASIPATVNDPKEYVEAPFSYRRPDAESVELNSGALTYTVTDFILPGKNGLDLAVKRRYDSSLANTDDVDIVPKDVTTYRSVVTFRYRLDGDDTTTTDTITRKGFLSSEAAQADADSTAEYIKYMYEPGTASSETGGRIVRSFLLMKCAAESEGTQSTYIAATRPNNHLSGTYGLGQGWSFCFPSIEAVPETYKSGRKDKVRFNDFLHLGDGRVYKIDLAASSGLKDYPLSDIKLQKVSGTSPVAYNYILSYKDGTKEYLQVCDSSVSQRSKLAAIEDRFGNIIKFTFNDNGGAVITDTLGRVVSLAKSGSTLTWVLPDGKTVIYTLNGNTLARTRDRLGRETIYEYTAQSAFSNPLSDLGDAGVTINHINLTGITHPTGAKSRYGYSQLTAKTDCGTVNRYVLASRSDVNPDGTVFNSEGYQFAVSGQRITTATVTKTGNIVETHTFNGDSQRTSEVVKVSSTVVSSKSFGYTNRLLTQESMTVPFAKTISFVYDNGTTVAADRKGNLTKQTESADSLSLVTDFTYDSTYSLPLTKTYKRDASTTIVEESVLRSDKKYAVMGKVLENGALKQATGFEYDAYNRLVVERRYFNISGNTPQASVSDNVVTYVYENAASLFPASKTISGVLDADGAPAGDISERFKYDIYGRVTERTDPNGNKTTFTYDALGRVTKELYADNTSKQNAYNDTANHITATDENGNKKRLEYTPLGQISKVYDISTNTLLMEHVYDNLCRLQKETVYRTGDKLITEYAYDYRDRPTLKRQTTQQGVVLYEEIFSYNDALITDAKTVTGDSSAPNMVTTVTRDKLGRVTRQDYGGGSFEVFSYDFVGNRLTAANARNAVTTWEYDFAGRAIKETNALGKSIITAYDSLGSKTKATDYTGAETTFRYDTAGRLLERLSPFEGGVKAKVKYYYDKAGNVTRQLVQNNSPGATESFARTDNSYDSRGRLVKTQAWKSDTAHDETIYTYDGVGNKLSVTTGGDIIARYAYNSFNRVTEQTDALGRKELFRYDAYGTLTGKTDRNTFVASYTYDALGRVLTESVKNRSNLPNGYIGNTYTKTGQKRAGMSKHYQYQDIHCVQRGSLTVTYSHDALGRLVLETEQDETGAELCRKAYTYDAAGNRASFTLTKGGVNEISTVYIYDNLNRLVEVQEKGAWIAKYTYDDNGNRRSLTYPNGTSTAYSYNSANLVTRLENKRGSAVLSSYAYIYRLDGNQLSKTAHDGNVTGYVYDRMGRLTSESADGTTISYSFDARGNRSKMAVTGPEPYETLYTYDLNNRLLKEEKTAGKIITTTCYTYDKNGNQLKRRTEILAPKGTSRERFMGFHSDLELIQIWGYNGFNQAIEVFADGKEVAYKYRHDGLRFQKSVDDVVTTHIWDGQNLCADAGVNGIFARYLRGGNLIARELNNKREFYHFNAHGDTIGVTDASGSLIKSYDYDAFGNQREADPNDANPFRYCGEYFDLSTGIYYLRNRYFSPRLGRFMREDPIKSGFNWYSYTANNPIRYIDPLGLAYTEMYSSISDKRPAVSTIKYISGPDSEPRAKYNPNTGVSSSRSSDNYAKSVNYDPWALEAHKMDATYGYNWTGKHVTYEFKLMVMDICEKLGIHPDDLMAVMAAESRFNPSAGSGAKGLIQFADSSPNMLGTTLDELANMSAVEQLDYVHKYLSIMQDTYGKLNDLGDIYMATAAPARGVGKPNYTTLYEVGKPGYKGNSALDINPYDGKITRGEFIEHLQRQISMYWTEVERGYHR